MLPTTTAFKAVCHSPSTLLALMGTTIAITAAATFWCVRGRGRRCFWSKCAMEPEVSRAKSSSVKESSAKESTNSAPSTTFGSNNSTDLSLSYLCNSCGTEKYSPEQLSSNSPPSKSPYKMVILVRNDLNMGKGKAAAQCCHAVLAAFKSCSARQPDSLKRWEREGQPKITLKIDSEDDMVELMTKARSAGITAESIRDAGRTQVAAGTRTVCAIGPAPAKLVDAITGHLKLY